VLGVAAGAVGVGLVAVVALGPSLHELRLVWNHFRTGTDWPQTISLTSIAWFVLLAGAVLVAALARRYAGAAVASAMVLAAIVLDLGHFSHGYNPMLAGSFDEIPSRATHDRALVPRLRPDSQMRTGFRDPRGHDPPQPRFRDFHLWQRAVPGQGLSMSVDIDGPSTPAATPSTRGPGRSASSLSVP
jgi:hypothetical protein